MLRRAVLRCAAPRPAGKKLDNGTQVVMLWKQPGTLDVLIVPPGGAADLSAVSHTPPQCCLAYSFCAKALGQPKRR